MPVDVQFDASGRTAVLTGDAGQGWRLQTSRVSWIWSGRGDFPWRNGWLGRAYVYLWPIPRSNRPEFDLPPSQFRCLSGDDSFKCEINARRLLVSVRLLTSEGILNPDLAWTAPRTEVLRATFHARLFDDDRVHNWIEQKTRALFSGGELEAPKGIFRDEYDVKGCIALRPDLYREPPEYRERFELPSAGLPSLGRRRRH